MGGFNETSTTLNTTLIYISNLLNNNNINNWFIAYGTLLGIVRDKSCINNDDDIDIIMDINNYDQLKKILYNNNFSFEYGHGIGNKKNIIKTLRKKNLSTIDFYMTTIDNDGNYNDTWNDVIWSNSLPLNIINWNDQILYLPNNFEEKLVGRYGSDWKIPQDNKGTQPPRKLI